MLFQVVPSVLLSMVALIAVFLLVKILQQPFRIFEISGFWCCHGEQYAGYHIKEHKNLYQNLVSKVRLHFVLGYFSRKQTVGRAMTFEYIHDMIISIFQVPFSIPFTIYPLNQTD